MRRRSLRMHIAIDIDSTLHPYWDQLAALARRRFGMSLPYEEQLTWAVLRLPPEQLRARASETHAEATVLAAEPYPGAVEVVRRWHRAGHRILIASHRCVRTHEATHRWLEHIDMPHDELRCCEDRVAHCRAPARGCWRWLRIEVCVPARGAPGTAATAIGWRAGGRRGACTVAARMRIGDHGGLIGCAATPSSPSSSGLA